MQLGTIAFNTTKFLSDEREQQHYDWQWVHYVVIAVAGTVMIVVWSFSKLTGEMQQFKFIIIYMHNNVPFSSSIKTQPMHPSGDERIFVCNGENIWAHAITQYSANCPGPPVHGTNN